MRKGQEIKVLPEERIALSQLQKYLQIYMATGDVELQKILQLISNKKVFINQIATEFYKQDVYQIRLTKIYIKEKTVIQIFYVIDFICKSELKIFRDAIKPYIVKLFVRVYKNQKEFGCDLIMLKTIFKSWFHVFPIQTLIDITNKIQQELRDDLDQISQEKIEELRKFYKNLNIVGYENFLNGTYKKPAQGPTKKVKLNPSVQMMENAQDMQTQNGVKLSSQTKQSNPQRVIQQQLQQQQQQMQQMPLQGSQLQPQQQQQQQVFMQYQQQLPQPLIQNSQQQFRNIPYHLNPQYNSSYPQQNAFQNNFPQLNPQPQHPQYQFLPPQIQQIQPLPNTSLQSSQQSMQQLQQPNSKLTLPATQSVTKQTQSQQQQQFQIIPMDHQASTVFGSLFQHFTEQLSNKQDLGNKDNVKEFLKKQIASSELLSNPNKFSTLMKCPTCFMRFRNQASYIQHLTNHATTKLEKLTNERKIESPMSCSVEQWMQSNTESKEFNNQEKPLSIDLDKLNSYSCVFCLEKFRGKWDSKNCQWVYENVRNYLLESNDLDEPQTISIHQKCNEMLNEFNA